MAGYHYLKCLELEVEVEKLKAENEKLKEVISYLPKVPTQPYEKELAQKCVVLEAENEKLKGEIEKLKCDLDCEISSHEFTRYHHDGQGVYIDSLAKQNEELKSRIAELEAKDKWQSEHMGKLSQDVFSLLEQLNSERARSAKLVEALKFYADQSSWEHGIAYATNNHLVDSDLYCERGDYFYGGKRARKALAEHEKLTNVYNDVDNDVYKGGAK